MMYTRAFVFYVQERLRPCGRPAVAVVSNKRRERLHFSLNRGTACQKVQLSNAVEGSRYFPLIALLSYINGTMGKSIMKRQLFMDNLI